MMSHADPAEHVKSLEVENARLRHLLEQRNVPSALRHQVRNALGMMRAILRRSAESKTSVEDLVAHVEGRFDALLRIQTALLSSPDATIDLATLVSDELLAQTISEGDKATITGSVVRIDSRRAELLGLVLHELATNAVKFGTATAQGHVDVSWTFEDSPARLLTLTWTETGNPRPDPHHQGFGLEAITAMLPYQLQADVDLEFRPTGLRCRIMLPMAGERA